MYLGIVVFGLLILGKALKLQLFEKDIWAKQENSTIKHKEIMPNRGNIYSSDGRLLAVSLPFYEIRMDFRSESFTQEIFDQGIDDLAKSLSNLFQDRHWSTYKRALVRARKAGERYYLVKRNVNYTQLQKVKDFPIYKLGPYKGGVIYVQQNKRVRPYGMLAARTVGYTMSGNQRSVVGLEGAFEKELRGVEGYRLERKVRGDIWMPVKDAGQIDPRDGYDVISTIDVDLQDVAENALNEQLMRHGADHGSVVVMEVSTGKVRAIANLSRQDDGSYAEEYNYAIGASTEPGSTFKLASVIALLEDGMVGPDDIVDTKNGVVHYYGQKMEDSGGKGLGKITVKRAFEKSSNVGISLLVNKHYAKNPERFVNRLYEMGLNQKLGVSIKGEGRPDIRYPDSELWSGVSLPWMSIGYEVSLTPLQILAFYNAIANDGALVKPRFAESLRFHGKVLRYFDTEVLNNRICSKETLEIVRSMMEGVVEEGTARNLANSHYAIAGKTGTTQISLRNTGYSKALHQASFVGYFPADSPRYSCIVVVNAPSKSIYYGNLVAGPIFREIADRIYVREYDLHPVEESTLEATVQAPYSKSGRAKAIAQVFSYLDMPLKEAANAGEWVSTRRSESGVELRKRSIPVALVPNVEDMGLADAVYLLEKSGLLVEARGRGTVVQQSLPPGKKARAGQTIRLQMSIAENR